MTPLQQLQTKLGVTPDNSFGPATFKAFMSKYGLSKEKAAHFFGQVAHECGNFTVFTENLNYSAEGLLSTFPKYFNASTAAAYARQPIKIANHVYANRMGNGNEASGDGYKYRGRGALQTTGKENYAAFAAHIKHPEIMANPDLVAGEFAFDAALFYFEKNGLWSLCNTVTDATITQVTKKVNGGFHGLDSRKILTYKFLKFS